jgi:hypothetical protein
MKKIEKTKKKNTGSQPELEYLVLKNWTWNQKCFFWGRTGTRPEPEVFGKSQEPPNPGLALVWYSLSSGI